MAEQVPPTSAHLFVPFRDSGIGRLLIALLCSYLLFTLLVFGGHLLLPGFRMENSGTLEILIHSSATILGALAGYYLVFLILLSLFDLLAYWDVLLALIVAILASSWILRWTSTIKSIIAQTALLVVVEFHGVWTFFRVFSDAMASMD